jgi:hypothetical protein
MKTKFFFFLAMLLMSSVGVFAQSETNTPLKGDLNEDGKVDAADVVVLVDIIMKKNVDPNKYYWYIGVDNPSSISNIQTDITVPGWHEIGSSLSGFEIEFNPGTQELHLSDERVIYNVIIPEGLNIYDSFGDNGEYMFTTLTCNIPGYKAFRYIPDEDFPAGTRDVTGVIIKSNDNIDSNKYYWYIGVDNPSSISNLQTDNTKPGWHEIGTSLSGFMLNTDTNVIDLGTPTRVIYNVIIPEGLHIYAADGTTNVESFYFNSIESNIPGYKAFKEIPSEYYPEGVWEVCGIIIK